MSFDKLYQDFLNQYDPDYPTTQEVKMKWFYRQVHRDATEEVATAHREGWEQAKREIECYLRNEERSSALHQQMAYVKYVADAIAAMTYKEKAND